VWKGGEGGGGVEVGWGLGCVDGGGELGGEERSVGNRTERERLGERGGGIGVRLWFGGGYCL